jgi:hypothetical protein
MQVGLITDLHAVPHRCEIHEERHGLPRSQEARHPRSHDWLRRADRRALRIVGRHRDLAHRDACSCLVGQRYLCPAMGGTAERISRCLISRRRVGVELPAKPAECALSGQGDPPVIIVGAAPGIAFATAPAATIQFQPQAQVVTDGSSVNVTVDYSCPPAPGFFVADIHVTLQESDGIGRATGTPTCDGQKHTLTIEVFGPGLTTGSAAASGEVDSGTISATTTAELKVS